MARARICLIGLAGLLAGCFDVEPRARMCQSPSDLPPVSSAVTYHQDVEPILAARCVRCHTAGGIGAFPLDSYAAAAAQRVAVRDAVSTRHMPPWPPASCCATYRDDRSMPAGEISTVITWIDQGVTEGAPAPPTVPTPRPTIAADITLAMPKAYLPAPPDGQDELRCFLLDWPASDTRYVVAADIQSTQPAQVHHAVVLTASKDQAARLAKQDGADGKPGWPCPGGIVDFKDFLGGSFFEPEVYEEGTGHQVDPSDKVILTVHYSRPQQGTFAPDQTSVLLQTQTQPTRRLLALTEFNPSWLLGEMPIPAGSPDKVYGYADQPGLLNGGKPFELYSVSLHMHERGSKGQVAILRANGDRECLLQIDEWHHGWQGEYRFTEPKTLFRGDQLLTECHFDNTAGHQRIVNGQMEAPRNLNWGETQEMCIAFVMATQAP